MLLECRIEKVFGREILDSRGNPTVEVEVILEDGSAGRAMVPSGASTGQFEAVELRDGGARFGGLGCEKAVNNVNQALAEALTGMDAMHQECIDKAMRLVDGTENKSIIGANAVLGVSLACAKAASKALYLPLYRYIGGIGAKKLPIPMMNIINGGCHISTNNLDVQEFMILPVGAGCLKEGVRWCAEVYQTLKKLLKERGQSVAVGDEGGFAPNLNDETEAIEIILEAIKQAGFSAGCGKDFMISLDVAASEWKSSTGEQGKYHQPKANKDYTTDELIEHWVELVEKYPIFSIEDPLDEEDWEGWAKLTERIGNKVRLVGDDLFVTNVKRLKKGIEQACGNAILIKPNQIGSLSETIQAVQLAQSKGMVAILSHRSGETEDTTIADLAVGLNTGFIKTGAPCRSERTAKYNRLLRIEEELANAAEYGFFCDSCR